MRKLNAGLAGLVVAALAACGGSGPVAGAAHPASVPGMAATARAVPAATSQVTGVPVAGATAFTGHGRLAFVSSGRLYVLDGTARGTAAVLHAVVIGTVAAGQVPGSPAWSADGKWLAFLVGNPGSDGAVSGGTLWIAGAEGQAARAALRTSGPFEWSPKADVVAALSGTALMAVRPGPAAHAIWEDPGFTGRLAWAPDGRSIAVSVINRDARKRFTGSAIDIVAPASEVALNNFAHSDTAALLIDGWWDDGNGLLAWSEPADSARRAAGGLPLVAYGFSGPYDVTLATTLPYPSFAVPGPGSGVTLVTGGNRYLWHGKTIASVTTAGTRRPGMDAEPAPVNLDPAWAAGAPTSAIAFVHASSKAPSGTGQAALSAWYATRQLWYESAAGGNPFPVKEAGTGIAAPEWSSNGQYILYVRDNALWLIRMLAPNGIPALGPAARIVSQLFPGAWPNHYAYTAWQAQFAWHA